MTIQRDRLDPKSCAAILLRELGTYEAALRAAQRRIWMAEVTFNTAMADEYRRAKQDLIDAQRMK